MRKLIIFIIALVWANALFAYDYSEHKEIGDAAFARFVTKLSQAGKDDLLFQYLNMEYDSGKRVFCYPELSVNENNPVSYGVLNGLGGDHSKNPLELEEQLRMKTSTMQQILLLHNRYMEMGFTSAPNGKLTQADFGYLLQAAVNMAHFYEYGKTFQQQLRRFDKDFIKQCQNPSLASSIFAKLNKTNAINMYVTLHLLAVDLAEQSGTMVHTHPQEARQLLFYAFLFNGFADHFLEDCFASGHLVVKRAVLESLTNNMALHNFYCAEGCTTVNREGEIWHAYGDKNFNKTHGSWTKDTTLLDIQYTQYTDEADRIIRAVQFSIEDIWNAFEQSYTDEGHVPFFNTIPQEKKHASRFPDCIRSGYATSSYPLQLRP